MPISSNPSSAISLGGTIEGQSIQKELLYSGSQQMSFSDARFRRLTEQPSGQINFGSARGKSHKYFAAIANRTSSEGVGSAISGDGNTVALGDYYDGFETDPYSRHIGSVTVYVRSGDTWSQQTIIRPTWTGYTITSNITGTYATYYYGPEIGTAVALSHDGNILAIGAWNDNSRGNNLPVGRVWIYTRSGTTWSLQTSLVPDDSLGGSSFGGSLSMTPDGTTLAVGGYRDYNYSSGITRGAVWVYTRSGTSWSKQAKLIPSGVVYGYGGANFGGDVSISSNGNTLAISSFGEHTLAKGACYIFTRSGSSWSQQQRLTYETIWPGGTQGYYFGSKVSISPDGNTFVTNAPYANSSNGAGALVFTRTSGSWSYRTSLYASGINSSGQGQGSSVLIAINPHDNSKYDIFSSVIPYTRSQTKMIRYTGDGASWTESERLTPSTAIGDYSFWGGTQAYGTYTKTMFASTNSKTIVIGMGYGGNTHILMK